MTQETLQELTKTKIVAPFQNSLGVVGRDLQRVLTLLSENITKEFEAEVSYIMVDKCNTSEWLATVTKKARVSA